MAIGSNNVIKISEMPTAPADAGGAMIIPVVYKKANYSISLERIASLVDRTTLNINNVDNTRDMDKPVSTATLAALANKADKVHSHIIGDVSGLQAALDALRSDISSVGNATAAHTHVAANITDFKVEVEKLIPAPTVIAGSMQW